jgi:beta-N-acetylhexosaminidase
VIRNAGAFNDAMRQQGIASCGKHFPGYSAATIDAHHDLPRIDRTRDQLDREELAVFRAFTGSGGSPNRHGSVRDHARTETIEVNRPYLNPVDSMMICHGWYPCFEPEKTPASLSHRVVTELLHDELGFDGLVMTDDLDMGAILNEYGLEETIRLAIAAGNDLAMICHRIAEIEQVHRILGTLPNDEIERALAAVDRFKKNISTPTEFSEEAFHNIDQEIWELRLAVLGEELARQRSSEDGKRSPVELY